MSSLAGMMAELGRLDGNAWGRYVFSRDILSRKIPDARKEEMIEKARECGRSVAHGLIRRVLPDITPSIADRQAERNAGKAEVPVISQYGTHDPFAIAEAWGLDVSFPRQAMGGQRLVFAYYTPPGKIEIMAEPLEKYAAVVAGDPEAGLLPTPGKVKDLLLAHELFHHFEETHPDIYTRQERIRLWSFFGFHNDSPVRALGEIAAMECAREITGVPYNPNILDVLLFYGYSKEHSGSIYDEILEKRQKDGQIT